MGYANEFNFLDYQVPAVLQSYKWKDVSWHNDISPRFENTELMLAVWVETTDPEKREYEDMKQYTVVKLIRINSEETTLADDNIFETEDMSELVEWLHKYELKELLEKAFTFASLDASTHDIADELAELLTRV